MTAGEWRGYVADTDLARRLCDVGESVSGRHRALQLRYALMAASVRETGAQVSPYLFRALLDAGVWNVALAYDHAQRVADIRLRIELIAASSTFGQEQYRRQVLREAVDLVVGFGSSS
jgi:hypothetical protein